MSSPQALQLFGDLLFETVADEYCNEDQEKHNDYCQSDDNDQSEIPLGQDSGLCQKSARQPRTRVTGREAACVPDLAEVVFVSVNDKCSAHQ